MQALLIAIIYRTISRYLGSGVMQRIEDLVADMAMQSDLPGHAKRQIVVSAIKIEYAHLLEYAIAAALEVVLLRKSDAR